MTRVRAAVLPAVGQPLEVTELELVGPGPGQVLVSIKGTGVCHSDLSVRDGVVAMPCPTVLGHEGAGVVEAVGEGVGNVAVGDPVVLSFVPPCGGCFHCTHDEKHLCETAMMASATSGLMGDSPYRRDDGSIVGQMSSLGTFAEAVVVPASGAVPIDPSVPLDLAALIGCAVLTGVGAVRNTAGVTAGATVAVFGCGGVGLNIVQGARLAGAERILAVDLMPAKLELAKGMGATDLVDASQGNAAAQILDLTGGRGVDVAFEAIGLSPTIEQAVTAARRGGQVVLVGLPSMDVEVRVPAMFGLVAAEKTIRGSWYGSSDVARDIPDLAAAYLDGSLRLAELVSGRGRLDDINTALDALRSGEAARTVIVP